MMMFSGVKKYCHLFCFLTIISYLFCAHTTPIPFYPTPQFTKIEKICQELSNDFDVLNLNRTLHYAWVEDSDYLLNKLLLLNDTLNHMVNNREESRSYLLEDIHYLFKNIIQVEQGYLIMYESTLDDPWCQWMYTLLQESKEKLDQLLLLNQETVAV
jgi:hypothetical protein